MVLATFNPKGGVGKTTTAVNVSAVLAGGGRSVLLVDLEAEMNASISLGVRPAESRPSVVNALLNECRPTDAVRPVASVPNLYLMAGSPSLAGIDTALRHVRQPERRLADVIRPVAATFQYTVLDCPSGYSLLTASVPLAADQLVVPIRADYLSLESLAHFFRWYHQRNGRRPRAAVAGILLTMVDPRRQATREIVEIIRLHNRRGVFRSQIPNDPRAAEAPSHGIPLVAYGRTRAARAYVALTRELIARIQRRGS